MEEAPKVPTPCVKEEEKKMSLEDELDCAEQYKSFAYKGLETSARRGAELEDEFTRLEVQIAAILVAFAGPFINFFRSDDIKTISASVNIQFLIKFGFAISILFLIISLIMGLLHIKRKEKWWGTILNQRGLRFTYWGDVIEGHKSFKEAKAFHEGTNLGEKGTVFSPKWTWILQTIFLGIAIMLLFILFAMFLFN